jgi:plastocyanin
MLLNAVTPLLRRVGLVLLILVLIFSIAVGVAFLLPASPVIAYHDIGATINIDYSQIEGLQPCGAISELRLLQTAVPATTGPATATLSVSPTPRPATATPRPAPSEDRVGFPEGYEKNFKLLFVFDRADNRQVRLICGNDIAASRKPGEPFPYGSVLVMITFRAKLDADNKVLRDDGGHFIRSGLAGIFVQRKEKGFGEAYGEDRSGEWEYVAYRPDGSHLTPPQNTNTCAACHLRQAGEAVDFVFRMDLFHNGEKAMVAPEVGENEVNIFMYEFLPQKLTVKAGTEVKWINNDEAEHNIVENDDKFESKNLKTRLIKEGDSFSFKFKKPGTYNYVCSIHPSMKGVIEVTE